MIYFFSFVLVILSNCVDDNHLFTTRTNIQLIKEMIWYDFRKLNNWFYENVLIFNPKECHFVSIGKDNHDEVVFYYDNLTHKNSNEDEIHISSTY